ncbi:MAG: DUF3868 domain-containing protein [Bacteroides sp.]|nr:DUF3868 domain-containing protein [Bacteroides sp.]
MKKLLLTSMIMVAGVVAGHSENVVDNVSVRDFSAEREGRFLSLDMTLGLSDLKVSSNQCVLIVPRIVNGNDSVSLPAVAVYGRTRYYYYQRNNGDNMLGGPDEISFMAKNKPAEVTYHQLLPYSEWMDGAHIALERIDRGCCQNLLLDRYGILGRYSEAFFPELLYICPTGEREKRRTLEGSSYIDFPVDRTEIYPEYRRNPIELDSIRRTIDVVRNDKDASIDSLWLKGFASPESPYSHNTDLAKGRTESLKQYINNLYAFGDDVKILTDYEPEDWAGLRRFVVNSNLANRDAIIELIDTDMDPDAKEYKIKKLYPADYKFMLDNFYPALRHTDYRVSYVIRSYSEPKEILEVMKTQPGKLDLNEFYVAASEFEPGTDEFAEVFETAARMFPNDEIANLNAANAAMRRGDLAGADRYIAKAGNTPEAIYSRGAIAIRKKDYDTARKYLREAAAAGLDQAKVTLDELNDRTNYKD